MYATGKIMKLLLDTWGQNFWARAQQSVYFFQEIKGV